MAAIICVTVVLPLLPVTAISGSLNCERQPLALAGRRHMEDHLFLMQVTHAGLRIAKTKLPLAFIYKKIFGESGLSADLWVMQRGELANYRFLYREGCISQATFLFFRFYSWIKFSRRVLIVKFRSLFHGRH